MATLTAVLLQMLHSESSASIFSPAVSSDFRILSYISQNSGEHFHPVLYVQLYLYRAGVSSGLSTLGIHSPPTEVFCKNIFRRNSLKNCFYNTMYKSKVPTWYKRLVQR